MKRLFLLAWLTLGAAGSAAASDLCGATVTGDVRLDHDLVCAGDGLIVGADGLRIDLNGHTIAGLGSGLGIVVIGRSDVTIAGGVIRNFAVALRLNTATGIVIRHNEFVDNGEAIDAQAGSVGNTIKENVFRGSTVRAIMLRGSSQDNDIKNNVFAGNRIGVLVFGSVDSQIKDNIFSGSSLAAIRLNVIATGNTIKDNTIGSGAAGIEFLITPTGSAAGNEFKANSLIENACGLKGPTAGNTFKDNSFEGNVANICL